MYTKCVHQICQNYKETEHVSMKSNKEEPDTRPWAAAHFQRVLRTKFFKSWIGISQSSKHRAFLSRHKHHIIQCGINLQISPAFCLGNPGQQYNKSVTLRGMTQNTPNMEKAKSQISCAIEQWRRRWSTDSPSRLHMPHQSRTKNRLLRRLSVIRILPRAAVQIKKFTLDGARDLQTFFQGKDWAAAGWSSL